MELKHLVPGIIVSLLVLIACLFVIISDETDSKRYVSNVCSYEGGTMDDGVCYRDGQVIPIKPQQR